MTVDYIHSMGSVMSETVEEGYSEECEENDEIEIACMLHYKLKEYVKYHGLPMLEYSSVKNWDGYVFD